ncbi:MAG: hypothetical protein J0L61_06440 [Planctomycetes bacterium]|nr:hypothetical protein [Planctomycetota bacterium]
MSKLSAWSAAAVAALGLAPSALGVFVISNGNASMRSALTPFLPDSALSTCDFFADAVGPDHMFGYNWAYRAPGSGNRGFSWLDTPTQTVAGDTLTLVYTNAGPNPVGFNRFNARLTVRVFDTVIPNTARVESTLEFQAAPTNLGPTVWELFNVNDFDLNGTPANDSYFVPAPGVVAGRVTEGASTDVINFIGVNAGRFEVGGGAAVRTKVVGGGLSNLSNAAGPAAGDGAVGYQWTVTLLPGQIVTLKSAFGVNMPPLPPPCPADLNNDGVVDTSDLVILLANFGTVVPPFTLGDINGDGIVNTADLVLFLPPFGQPC